MYWPSCSADGVYVYKSFDKPFCSLDGLLGMYGDWQDVAQWPQVPGTDAIARRRLAKQEDPTTKKGVVGAFCRTYTITQAMDKFLPGLYEETAVAGRYTYTGGETTGGAIIYDGDMFLYSHHSHDPCCNQLVNAFDLVRLHKFGDQDADVKEGTPTNRMPSFTSMSHLATGDKAVSDLMAKERYEQAQAAFQTPQDASEDTRGDYDLSWLPRLTKDGNGRYEKTINNAVIVLENDPLLKGRIVTDEFASCGMVLGKLPWDMRDEKRRWKDVDDAGFYRYMETFYGLTGREKMDNALLIMSAQNRINDVKRYLQGLKWDGVKRVENILPDYLGAEDNAYTRAVMRKALCAAVARAVVGGVKFDYMPIFVGPQGIGKSTLLAILGNADKSPQFTRCGFILVCCSCPVKRYDNAKPRRIICMLSCAVYNGGTPQAVYTAEDILCLPCRYRIQIKCQKIPTFSTSRFPSVSGKSAANETADILQLGLLRLRQIKIAFQRLRSPDRCF